MTFSNPIVAGEELIRSAIRSEDYVQDVSGWRIARDGDAQFSTINLLGQLNVPGTPYSSEHSSNEFTIYETANPGSQMDYEHALINFTENSGADRIQIAFDSQSGLEFRRVGVARVVVFNGANGFLYSGDGTPAFSVEGWNNFPFAAGWTADVSCQYKLLPDGTVRLRGIGNYTTNPVPDGTAVFTLPVGYRPTQYTLIPIAFDASTTKGRCEIQSNGVVSIYDAPNDLPCFDSITFSSI